MSCSDDDDKNNEDTPDEEVWTEEDNRMAQEADALCAVLSTLTGQEFTSDGNIDFEGKTFEPQYGEVRDPSKPLERSVQVLNATTAESYFRGLVEGNGTFISNTSDGLVIDLTNLNCREDGRKQSLGTLTFHRGEGSDNVGYADIDIPCIPKLQRISYKTEEQWGDNANWTSPAKRGEVYRTGDHYYICVRASKGSQSFNNGALVMMEDSYGSDYKYYNGTKESDESWEPNHVGTYQDICDYIDLCGDNAFYVTKQMIVKKLPWKVFPVTDEWTSWEGAALRTWDPSWGFGTDKKGYAHWTGRNSTGSANVIICRDATEGDYNWKKVRWARRFHYVGMPWRCEDSNDGVYQNTKSYYYNSKKDFRNWIADGSIVYTANVYHFNDKLPSGFVKVDVRNM
jgi:hypothetical protein